MAYVRVHLQTREGMLHILLFVPCAFPGERRR